MSLFDSYQLTSNLKLQNRAVRSATAMGFASPIDSGLVTDEAFKFYESLAAGKLGMLIMEHAFVDQRGWAGHAQLGIQNDGMIEQHKKLVQTMRSADPKGVFCCQLAHTGPVGCGENKVIIDTEPAAKLAEIPQLFANAAVRAEKAGYDCVQLHSAHGYFLNSTISTALNHRTDEYKAADFKLLADTLAAVRAAVKIPVGVKLSCDDFVEGSGMTKEQAAVVIQTLAFDFVEISGGIQDPICKVATIRGGKDSHYYQHVFKHFKELNLHKKQPIIITGGYNTVGACQVALDEGAELIGFSRLFLRDDKFLLKNDESIKCVRCCTCIKNLISQGQAYCVLKLAEDKKKHAVE